MAMDLGVRLQYTCVFWFSSLCKPSQFFSQHDPTGNHTIPPVHLQFSKKPDINSEFCQIELKQKIYFVRENASKKHQ